MGLEHSDCGAISGISNHAIWLLGVEQVVNPISIKHNRTVNLARASLRADQRILYVRRDVITRSSGCIGVVLNRDWFDS